MNANGSRWFWFSLLCVLLVTPLMTMPAPAHDGEEEEFTPRTGAPPGNRIGGASRNAASEKDAVTVSILAPAETAALTAREQPVVYWSLSGDTSDPIAVVVTDLTKLEEPLLEVTLEGGTKRGLHKLDLAKVRQDGKPVKLRPGVKYEVAIEVVADEAEASKNPSASCKVVRIDPKDAPAAAAKEKDAAKRASAYGKAGLWLDYVDALNAAIEAAPRDEALRLRRTKALAAQRLVWSSDGTVTEMPKEKAGDAADE
jgi:hypothetical protein